PAMSYSTVVHRRRTREVAVGPLVIGGENPVSVQSMTTTKTSELEATLAQIRRLEEVGCELVRVTVPKKADLDQLAAIKERTALPIICDIHYDYNMALGCLEARTGDGRHACDKIRINPGNIGGLERYKE